MSQSYYQPRVHYWLEDFDHPINIKFVPSTSSARARMALDLSDTGNASRGSSDLSRHMDERHQMKDVKLHSHLLETIRSQLDDAMPTIPDGTRINERNEVFYEAPRGVYLSESEVQLQTQLEGFVLLSAASRLASIITFLLAEESDVLFHPLCAHPNAWPDIPDHEVTFVHNYCECTPFSESRPLHPDTKDRIKRFAAATSYLK
jgi:hypothetical protein